MKLRRMLYWIFVFYVCINTIYTFLPLIMTFACVPTTAPFYNPVISSLITYRLIMMTYLHMIFDLVFIIVLIRSCMKQKSCSRTSIFTLVMLALNFLSNLVWTFVGYIYSIQ